MAEYNGIGFSGVVESLLDIGQGVVNWMEGAQEKELEIWRQEVKEREAARAAASAPAGTVDFVKYLPVAAIVLVAIAGGFLLTRKR